MLLNKLKISFLFLLLLSNIGCGLHIGESVDTQSVQGFSLGCLNEAGKKVEAYLSGKAEVNQIYQLSNCIKTALNVFKEQVQGDTVDEFTPNELRKFIQELFLQDRTISDSLLAQLIHLKKVIIGGSEDKLTRKDIDRFIVFINIFTEELVFLQPYIQIFYDPEKSFLQLSESGELEKLQNDLRQSVDRISDFAERFSHSYAFSDIEILVRELDLIANGQVDIQDLDKKMEIIKAVKSMSVNGSEAHITPEEWGDLLLGYFYSISFTSHYSILKNSALISVQSMRHARSMLNSVLSFLLQAIQNHPDKIIPELAFVNLINTLQSAQWMPVTLTEQSIKNILIILFGKIFNVDKERYGIVELSEIQLEKMRHVMGVWMETQSFLDNSIKDDVSILDTITFKMISPFVSAENILFSGERNILYNLFSLKPLYREDDKVYLSRDIYEVKTQPLSANYKNLTIYNFYHLIAEMIRVGYQTEVSEDSGIKQSEIDSFFTDFYPVQMAMGLVPRTDSSHLGKGEMEFLFTKMALPSSKGFTLDVDEEQEVSVNEIIQYFSYAFSIGFSLKDLYLALSEEQCLLGSDDTQLDPHLKNYDKKCVLSYFLSHLYKHVENMPDLVLILQNMNNEDKNKFMEVLLNIAFDTDELAQSSEMITNYQIRYMFTALYLIETTMNRFDFNNDSLLQEDELWEAYKIFKGYLRRVMVDLVCIDELSIVPPIYAYTVHNKGNMPLNPSMGDMSQTFKLWTLQFNSFLHDTVGYNHWDMELDRIGLTQVYSNLGKVFISKKKERQKKSCEEVKKEED